MMIKVMLKVMIMTMVTYKIGPCDDLDNDKNDNVNNGNL